MKFFWCVIGVVLVIEGIPWFLSPQGLKRMLVQMLPVPERTLRMMGLLLIAGRSADRLLCGDLLQLMTSFFRLRQPLTILLIP